MVLPERAVRPVCTAYDGDVVVDNQYLVVGNPVLIVVKHRHTLFPEQFVSLMAFPLQILAFATLFPKSDVLIKDNRYGYAALVGADKVVYQAVFPAVDIL